MDLYEMSFAKIIILNDNVAEVMVNEGVEMDEPMVKQYHDFLRSHLQSPFYLLINKINAYTYNYQAQMNLEAIKEIIAMAVSAYNRVTEIATKTLASYPRSDSWNLQIFSNRSEALDWLLLEQKISIIV